MGALDLVTRMKSEGRGEQEIIKALQQQGIPPRDIQDALSQAQIKSAVVGESGASPMSGMQQSIMDHPPMGNQQAAQSYYAEGGAQDYYQPGQEDYVPTPQAPMDNYPGQSYGSQNPQGYPAQQSQMPSYGDYQQDSSQDLYPQQNPYAESGITNTSAGGYDYGSSGEADYGTNSGGFDPYSYSSGVSDTGTLIDIAEQVVSEKTKKTQRQLDDLSEFKALSENAMKSFEERLKRIESVIDQLQMSILDKIGSYGKSLNSIKKEMVMMQDSFGKAINPILDRKKRI